MLSKCIKIFVLCLFIFLAFGIYVHYDLIKEQPKPQYMCHKGKLIHKLDDGETVYLKVKNVSCEFEKGMIIIEEQL